MNPNLPSNEFERAAKGQASPTLLAEFWEFLRHNKKWWLLPILIVLLVFGILIFLSGTGAAAHLLLLGGGLAGTLALAPWACAAALRISSE